jgi:hypothetical protein
MEYLGYELLSFGEDLKGDVLTHRRGWGNIPLGCQDKNVAWHHYIHWYACHALAPCACRSQMPRIIIITIHHAGQRLLFGSEFIL